MFKASILLVVLLYTPLDDHDHNPPASVIEKGNVSIKVQKSLNIRRSTNLSTQALLSTGSTTQYNDSTTQQVQSKDKKH